MPKINIYTDINAVEAEARKDYIDRHSPFIHCEPSAKAGETFEVTVQVGAEYQHPDDMDHYISSVALFNRETKIAEATFFAGSQGGQDKKGNTRVTFGVVLDKNAKLVAQSYCTKHGIWESIPVDVAVA
ncbi:desulfoferrodoxin family protein [Pseudomaricurvus sp. HS19]|uniref:desulfoferrodoxin family protein n=1 Tax=Pseudomaricurvus sp. HS19 TaxID=2692626 RepID=UPI001367EEEC|nr:desulfoferrodoxin family protein [Pseudomaricurvus sp. HS19]MYM64731.1 dethiobiotin synthase [Pseudomaricurvus sp. HS19]